MWQVTIITNLQQLPVKTKVSVWKLKLYTLKYLALGKKKNITSNMHTFLWAPGFGFRFDKLILGNLLNSERAFSVPADDAMMFTYGPDDGRNTGVISGTVGLNVSIMSKSNHHWYFFRYFCYFFFFLFYYYHRLHYNYQYFLCALSYDGNFTLDTEDKGV